MNEIEKEPTIKSEPLVSSTNPYARLIVSSNSNKPLSFPPSKSSPPISTLNSRTPPLSAIRWDPNKTHLCYFADFASKLARDGRLQDLAMIVESIVLSGIRGSKFTATLRVELVVKGKVGGIVDVLSKVDELGVPPLKLFDGYAMELLGRQSSTFEM